MLATTVECLQHIIWQHSSKQYIFIFLRTRLVCKEAWTDIMLWLRRQSLNLSHFPKPSSLAMIGILMFVYYYYLPELQNLKASPSEMNHAKKRLIDADIFFFCTWQFKSLRRFKMGKWRNAYGIYLFYLQTIICLNNYIIYLGAARDMTGQSPPTPHILPPTHPIPTHL